MPHPLDSLFSDLDLNKAPTHEEIKETIKRLPSHKAAGPDGITSRILQASGEQAIQLGKQTYYRPGLAKRQ